MTGRKNGRAYQCVLLDINTQRDFCASDGTCPVANLGELLPALRAAVAWARRNHVPVVSSIESHRPFELSDSGTPIHCVDGSCGQHKLSFTLFPLRTKLEADNTLAIPTDLFDVHQQVIFRKRTDDLLLNPKADRLLTQLPADEFTLFGTGLETSIKAVALALLARGKRVNVLVDACGYWNKASAELALRQVTAKGANLISLELIRSRQLDRRFRYPFVHRNGSRARMHAKNGNPTNGAVSGRARNGSSSNGKERINGKHSASARPNGTNGNLNGNGKH